MSLRKKLVLAIGGLILLLGVGGTLHARLTLAGISQDELERRALAVSRDLESHAGESMLTNDIFGLYQRINELATANDDIRYVVVFDAQGKVKASTFANGLPVGLRDSNRAAIGQPYSLATLSTNEGNVLDVAYPVQGGRLGVIRLGVARGPMESEVNGLTSNLLELTGAVLVIGLIASYLLATVLTRPLARLTLAARAMTRGEPSSHDELYSHPEIGQVAIAFDEMTHKLREREEERAQLLAKVIAAQEEERRRISRELHDDAGQVMTSVLLGLAHLERAAEEPLVQAEAAELRAATAVALDRLRDMARELRPSALDDLGLEATLQRYVADYGRKHASDVDFQSQGFHGSRLSPATETALYRIAQEALTNVVRHAQAESVSVLLERRDGHAILVVEDDGSGFDVDALRHLALPAAKLGLLGMEERAALVGGTLTVESNPGKGTAVFAEVPVRGLGP